MNNNDVVPFFNEELSPHIKLQLQPVDGVQGCIVIYLTGYIDTFNTPFFNKKVEQIRKAGFTKLIFDCNALNQLYSTGVGAFADLYKSCAKTGEGFALCGVTAAVLNVLSLLGFAKYFNIKRDVIEALAFFTSAPEAKPLFPAVIVCPICDKRLRAPKHGSFRCPKCHTVLVVQRDAKVLLR
jgi:anti-sigma B factor antagonist